MSGFHFSPRPNRAAEIRWRPWGEEAFDESRTSGKPILLSISAVWCHWCHVMDETTYSSEDVIDAVNRLFVAVRVDNDQRPDVNARYNQGGWPTTALLTHDGDLLKGATYVPPDQMHRLLLQVDAFYRDAGNRLAIAQAVADAGERRARALLPDAGTPKPDAPDRIFSMLDAAFDERFGGFGTDQKFPQTPALHFLLDRAARREDDRAREMIVRTLRAMAGGGMYDHVHGGFYRYSTTRDYTVPHFEKMLEDLGGLLLACARAHALFDDPDLGLVAIDVRRYMDAHLWQADFRAYGGSQDADEEYYQLDAAGRALRTAPYVDPTIYASWNAEAARALIVAGPLLTGLGADAADWTSRGLTVLESLWSTMLVDGLMCRFHDGTPQVRGLLADQAWCAWAALSAFEATGERIWLHRAVALVEAAEPLFDERSGAYADRLADGDSPGRLVEPSFPMDDNALMALVHMRAASFTADAAHGSRAQRLLESFAGAYRSYGTFAAGYGSATLDRFSPALDVKIVGLPSAPPTITLREAARAVARPPVAIDIVDPASDAARLEALGQPAASEPTGYICDRTACFARARDADGLRAALSHATARYEP